MSKHHEYVEVGDKSPKQELEEGGTIVSGAADTPVPGIAMTNRPLRLRRTRRHRGRVRKTNGLAPSSDNSVSDDKFILAV